MKVQRLDRKIVGEDLPEMVCINFYVLEDPRTNEVRYVGRTVDPGNRYRNHIWEAKQNNRNHKERWIVSLLRHNLKPVMRIFWTGMLVDAEINKVESKIIKHLSKKYNLTNALDRARNVSVVQTKPVYQFTMQGIFIGKHVSANQAALSTGVGDGGITVVCNNPLGRGNRSRGGFLWSFDHTPPPIPVPEYRRLTTAKETYQYDKEGNLLNVFPSARMAGEETGVSYKKISACASGRQKTAGGFVWKLMKI